VVGSQGKQQTVHHQNVLEVVYDTFAVQKVHGSAEEIPVERLGKAQTPGFAGDVCDGNDLLEGYDLDGGDDDDNVEVAGSEGQEEEGNHNEGPYCARYEVCLFLLVLALGLFGYLAVLAIRLQTEKTREGEGVKRTEGGPSSLVVLPLSLYSDMLCESLRTRGLLALRA
jgi:hypothetical protein